MGELTSIAARMRRWCIMKKIIVASIGNCVHVAGIMNFLFLAEREGYATQVFRGCYFN
jgi:hypothetical protein